jgi:hypothetical protein
VTFDATRWGSSRRGSPGESADSHESLGFSFPQEADQPSHRRGKGAQSVSGQHDGHHTSPDTRRLGGGSAGAVDRNAMPVGPGAPSANQRRGRWATMSRIGGTGSHRPPGAA